MTMHLSARPKRKNTHFVSLPHEALECQPSANPNNLAARV